jgi:hypothetical protein
MNIQEFEQKTGRAPEHDDLDRVNCLKAGQLGHYHCGWCDNHDGPIFECGCVFGLVRPTTKVHDYCRSLKVIEPGSKAWKKSHKAYWAKFGAKAAAIFNKAFEQ